MTDLRAAAQQALEALETVFMPHHPAVIALKAALAEEALQRLSDANQEIEAVLEQPIRAQKMRDAGYTRRPTLREIAALEQPEQPDQSGKTGWPPGLLQDDCRGLSKWLASQPDARRRVREAVAALEQESKWRLSCGCPSQHGGIPAEWPETTREGGFAVAYGVVCEKHWHEYEARCPNCASLEAQNTELDRKLAELESNA